METTQTSFTRVLTYSTSCLSFDSKLCQLLSRVKLPFLLELLRKQDEVISLPQQESVTGYHSGYNEVPGHRRAVRPLNVSIFSHNI